MAKTNFWKKAARAFWLGLKMPVTERGRPIRCMVAEAEGKPCDCGHIWCKGWRE